MRTLTIGTILFAVIGFTAGVATTRAQDDTGAQCASAKEQAAAKLMLALTKCHAKGVRTGVFDPVCGTKAAAKYTKAFAKAEAGGDCAPGVDALALARIVETAVNDLAVTTASEDCSIAMTVDAVPQVGFMMPDCCGCF